MSKRVVPVLLVGMVFLAGFVLADEPAGQYEPPVRLKKKKPKGDDKAATDPAKKDDKKKDQPKTESREADPVTRQEEEKEVYQRVVKNVRNVDARLAKNDLGEGTRQTQRDILKDIESLIQRGENPPPQGGEQQDQNNGGGGGEDQNPMDKDKQDQKDKGGEGSQAGSEKGGAKQSGTQKSGGQKSGSQQGKGKQSGSRKNGGQKPGSKQPGGKKPGSQGSGSGGSDKKPGGRNGKDGNGGGGDSKDNPLMNRNADLYKDVWGHLPETLRAQMDAYSNPQPFLPKYDDLIKRYYRTIAEQGRRKGE